MSDNGRKSNGHALDNSDLYAQDEEIRSLDRRLDLLAEEVRTNHEIVNGKLDRLLKHAQDDRRIEDLYDRWIKLVDRLTALETRSARKRK